MQRALLAMSAVLLPSVICASSTLEEDMPLYELKDYVVRAWHFEEAVLDVPADVVLIGRDAIEDSLALSVPDLLETEANLYFSNVSGFTNVALRGFGEGSGLRTLILIDGQPLNPADMGRINWEQIPLDAIESIEVLHGGHNVLYGDKALSGVIKIETRRTGDERLDIQGRVGSFNTTYGSLSGSIGGSKWGLDGGILQQESDGYRENSRSEVRNAYLKFGGDLKNGDQADFRLAVGEAALTYPGGITRDVYLENPRASSNLGDEGSRNRYATITGRVMGESDFGSWEVLGGFDHNDIKWSFGEGRNGDNQQTGYNLKPRGRIEIEDSVLIVGADLLYDGLDSVSEDDIGFDDAALSEIRFSAYLFTEFGLTERLTLSGGVRHEWIEYQARNNVFAIKKGTNRNGGNSTLRFDAERSFDETIREDGLSAECSLNFRLSEDLSLWAGYDRAYRYPVFDERAGYQRFPLAELVAQDLEAEEGDQFEIGMKWLSGPHELYLTAYLLQMKNEIIFDSGYGVGDEDSPGNGLNRNLGAVDRYGGDLAYHYREEDWGLSFALAYVQTEMLDGIERFIQGETVLIGIGKDVPLVPSLVTTSQIWWEPLKWLRLRLVHRYVDKRYQGGDFANELDQIEDYQLVQAQAEAQVGPNCRVFIKGDNLFNQRYPESVYSGLFYPGAGRFLQAGATLSF